MSSRDQKVPFVAKYGIPLHRLTLLVLLMIHAALIAWMSVRNTPNLDEPGHLVAGLSHLRFGRFELYRVNPPLVRMIAAIPVAVHGVREDWSGWRTGPYSRSEFTVGLDFLKANGADSVWYVALARLACIPLCLIGAWTCYRWSFELYGGRSALLALALYTFCPNLLAWGASITPDAAASALGLFAAFTFRQWLRAPGLPRALAAAGALGLAELAKATWCVLFLLWPAAWAWHRWRPSRDGEGRRNPASAWQLAVIVWGAIYLLNLAYGFERSFVPLGQFEFVSRSLGAKDHVTPGNRFRGTLLEHLPIPFPENYLHGIDVQKRDFEEKKWSYLRGEQRKGSWWYYYLYALAVKTPCGTVLLALLGIVLSASCRPFALSRDDLFLLTPAVVVFVLVSSQTGFGRYLRYVLPCLPFVYVWISGVARAFDLRMMRIGILSVILVLASAVESLSVFPHSMSFFNAFVGGPNSGPAHLLDANVDWGQDLLYLRDWLAANPHARPIHVAYFGPAGAIPAIAGRNWKPVPPGLVEEESGAPLGPQPGWFAVSVNHVFGYRHYEWSKPDYVYFREFEPVARTGYSIRIYHITLDEANRVRRKLGLPLL